MKYFYLPSALLCLLLALSLWNANKVESEIDDWCSVMAEASEAAARGDNAAALAAVSGLREEWRMRRTFYHSILEHDELNDAEELLVRAESVLLSGDADEFTVEAAALAARLRAIAEKQELRIENVF
ncbi:MAG: DUF4363 family protein [Oscillospiraceae bacterium]|nr:DUF4363 family protein [Oscillospiraceae bacterium]